MILQLLIPAGRFGRQIYNTVLISAGVFILFVCASFIMVNHAFEKSQSAAVRFDTLEGQLNLLHQSLVDQETGQRGYDLTGKELFLEPYESGTRLYMETAEKIRANPDLHERMRQAADLAIEKGLVWHDHYGSVQVVSKKRGATVTEVDLLDGKSSFDAFRFAVKDALRVLRLEKEESTRSLYYDVIQIFAVVSSIMLASIAAYVIYLSGNIRKVSSTMHSLSEAVQSYAEKKFDVPVPNHSNNDELRQLINGIDAMRMELNEKFIHIETMADTDGLTGIPNRRYLDEKLQQALAKAQEEGQQMAFILCDVDKFKMFNDTYGHLEGDRVLKHVARLLASHMGPVGLVARYGGEEFSVLLPSEGLQSAVQYAEHLKNALHHFPLPPYQVTMSFGVSEYRDGDTASSLIERADKAMYQAKSSGRDCVRTEE
ncbi:diguanylate cyclase domain-containing protein [Paenibacillus nasutitermitis]|uniref:Diguanylate cyclase (GGDEF) domain-containing protein n=1 Tax=Paenibacillus nasutitermitis TaxID=1652958 RepID=A0A916ZBE4_9BACL|nr:diguanylate cyclase [Paenibacillus nasutitermitis]GGD84330.1 hypothetical protein GCM10010911_48280 [Paenibacillus nasutitermitis]